VGRAIESHARSRVKRADGPIEEGPAPLAFVLAVTFLGSVSGGVFWIAIFFVTLRHYRFTESENLGLALGMGAIYGLVAYGAGRIYAWLRTPARRVLSLSLVAWGLFAALPVVLPSATSALWAGALLGAAASGLVWPGVESYLGARRHGADLRRSIGSFNVVWTLATALPLLVFPLLTRFGSLTPLLLCTVMNGLAALALRYLPQNPARSEPEVAAASVGREYALLLRSSSALLPLGYLMSSTLSPVLPHRLQALGPSVVPASMIAATWMVARWLTLVVMARLTFWHGRWAVLLVAFVSLTGGLGLVLLAPSVTSLALGLLLFGVGMGVSYFATLYYSLSVGHGAVDAGGGFEALVGLGYVLGPLVGLAGHSFEAGASSVTVGLTWACALAGGILALRPYRTARLGRS